MYVIFVRAATVPWLGPLMMIFACIICGGMCQLANNGVNSWLNTSRDFALTDAASKPTSLEVIANPSVIVDVVPCDSKQNTGSTLLKGIKTSVKSFYVWNNGTLWWEIQSPDAPDSTLWVANNAQRIKVTGVLFAQNRPTNVPLNTRFNLSNCVER